MLKYSKITVCLGSPDFPIVTKSRGQWSLLSESRQTQYHVDTEVYVNVDHGMEFTDEFGMILPFFLTHLTNDKIIGNPNETVPFKIKSTKNRTVFIYKCCKAYKNMQHIKIKPELFEGHARWPSQTGQKTATEWARLAILSSWYTLAGVFYNVKNGSSFIMSKSLSKNLSDENKHCCFWCLL